MSESLRVRQMGKSFGRSRRAVSTTVSYTLTLGITALLVVGLLAAGGNFIDNTQEQAVREELRVVGQQISSDISRADRLVVAADDSDPTVRLTMEFPAQVAGTQYRVRLDNSSDRILLETINSRTSVAVGVQTETDLANSTASGGTMRVVYTNDALEVRDD